jgi:hypothetical protein
MRRPPTQLPQFLAAAFAIALLSFPAQTHARGFYAPNVAFAFKCDAPPSESQIENFLAAHGFTVVNAERMRRQYGRGFYPLEIDGTDQRRWAAHVMGLIPDESGTILYTAAIESPPPTRHDNSLEDATVAFVTDTLKCRVEGAVTRGENPVSAQSDYDQIFAMQQGRNHEAQICDKTLSTYDAKACAMVPGVPQ